MQLTYLLSQLSNSASQIFSILKNSVLKQPPTSAASQPHLGIVSFCSEDVQKEMGEEFRWVLMAKEGVISVLLQLNGGFKIQSGGDTVCSLISWVCVHLCVCTCTRLQVNERRQVLEHYPQTMKITLFVGNEQLGFMIDSSLAGLPQALRCQPCTQPWLLLLTCIKSIAFCPQG